MIATAKRAQVRSSLEVLLFRYFLSIVVCPLSGPVAGVVFRPPHWAAPSSRSPAPDLSKTLQPVRGLGRSAPKSPAKVPKGSGNLACACDRPYAPDSELSLRTESPEQLLGVLQGLIVAAHRPSHRKSQYRVTPDPRLPPGGAQGTRRARGRSARSAAVRQRAGRRIPPR